MPPAEEPSGPTGTGATGAGAGGAGDHGTGSEPAAVARAGDGGTGRTSASPVRSGGKAGSGSGSAPGNDADPDPGNDSGSGSTPGSVPGSESGTAPGSGTVSGSDPRSRSGAVSGSDPASGSGTDARPGDERSGAASGGETGWSWRRPELGLAVLVLALGAFVIVGTADVTAAGSTLGLGPRFFPALVGGSMLLIGLFYVVDVLRGGRGDPEDAEDIDPGTRADWRTVALVSVIFLAFAGLLDLLGWIIAGALLFFGLSVTLGAAHRLRAGVIAILLSTITYLVFVKGLGVTLPAGLLSGVI
ncbi:tripartite tricarboxylate transporter TctB family protein [Streptosporangium sp. NPDC002524]|uniref:tripartite tricarboxylate transporter TctB family protein n=1 Tax=Streptosporangium sp. NPDC002524 TaxID=3154537 RepID=UPI003334104A